MLITDYSSMMVDFATTGLPMLFFAYDLEEYAETVRGFYVAFAETVPGAAAADRGRARRGARRPRRPRARRSPARRDAFVAGFCPLDDGGAAAARVADRVFS